MSQNWWSNFLQLLRIRVWSLGSGAQRIMWFSLQFRAFFDLHAEQQLQPCSLGLSYEGVVGCYQILHSIHSSSLAACASTGYQPVQWSIVCCWIIRYVFSSPRVLHLNWMRRNCRTPFYGNPNRRNVEHTERASFQLLGAF
jgi:hypothetical protein